MKGISILYEDYDVLVLDKPSGITVNNSDTTKGEETVQDWIENKLKAQNLKLEADPESDFYKRAGIVHRIDKETSGILLVAKNPEAFENMQRQFKERTVKKTYLALAHGKVAPETGQISVPVGRLPWDRKKFGVLAGGREAVTKYKVLGVKSLAVGKKEEPVSLLELYPETGRTHQIRVHLKYISHPIFADFLYAGRKTSRDDRKLLGRVFLHAYKISFMHPVTGKQMSLESPLPEELQRVIDLTASNV
jgi:23S rRNA pseudouridine1911/1915/1917 synthase